MTFDISVVGACCGTSLLESKLIHVPKLAPLSRNEQPAHASGTLVEEVVIMRKCQLSNLLNNRKMLVTAIENVLFLVENEASFQELPGLMATIFSIESKIFKSKSAFQLDI